MSLGEYMKMSLKQRGPRLSATNPQLSLVQRNEEIIQKRRESRQSLIFKKRHLHEMTLSPIYSPVKPIKKTPIPPPKKVDKRLQLLKQWQEKKKKLMENKKNNQKPIFKVYHVTQSTSYNNIDKALTEIKGKPIKALSKVSTQTTNFKVAPSSTHKFKPPANIKPLYFKQTKSNQTNKVKKAKIKQTNTKSTEKLNRKLNFAHSPTNKLEKLNVPPSKDSGITLPNKHNDDDQINNRVDLNTPELQDSSDKENTEPEDQTQQASSQKTQNSDNLLVSGSCSNEESNCSTIYLSPFVSVSRGKRNARKEYENKLKGESCINDGDGPSTAATHFKQVVLSETNRLQKLCEDWNQYKLKEAPPEGACDMINVSIGQTELLLNKKMKQFINLIDCHVNRNSEKPITEFDLHGFWDTVMLQIKNIDKRFNYLDTLKLNNWDEILPAASERPKRKATQRKIKASASSSLKDAIRAAKIKQKENLAKLETTPVKTPRRSFRTPAVLRSKCTTCSPCSTKKLTSSVPPKSILKSGQKFLSTEGLRKSKSVVFGDLDNKHNKTKSNSIRLTPSPDMQNFTPRRSARLLAKHDERL